MSVLLVTLALVSLTLVGCSVVVRYDHYMPRAEQGEILGGQNHPAGDTIRFKEDDYYIQLAASPLSQKTVSFGPMLLPVIPGSTIEDAADGRSSGGEPLKIFMSILVKHGSAKIDLGRTQLHSAVLAGVASPVAVMRFHLREAASPEPTKLEAVESIQTIEAPPPSTRMVAGYVAYYNLHYEVAMRDVNSFELKLAPFEVNGRSISLPPVAFTRKTSTKHLVWP